MKDFTAQINALEGEIVNVHFCFPNGVAFDYRGKLNILGKDKTKLNLCMSQNPHADMWFERENIANIVDTNTIILR